MYMYYSYEWRNCDVTIRTTATPTGAPENIDLYAAAANNFDNTSQSQFNTYQGQGEIDELLFEALATAQARHLLNQMRPLVMPHWPHRTDNWSRARA